MENWLYVGKKIMVEAKVSEGVINKELPTKTTNIEYVGHWCAGLNKVWLANLSGKFDNRVGLMMAAVMEGEVVGSFDEKRYGDVKEWLSKLDTESITTEQINGKKAAEIERMMQAGVPMALAGFAVENMGLKIDGNNFVDAENKIVATVPEYPSFIEGLGSMSSRQGKSMLAAAWIYENHEDYILFNADPFSERTSEVYLKVLEESMIDRNNYEQMVEVMKNVVVEKANESETGELKETMINLWQLWLESNGKKIIVDMPSITREANGEIKRNLNGYDGLKWSIPTIELERNYEDGQKVLRLEDITGDVLQDYMEQLPTMEKRLAESTREVEEMVMRLLRLNGNINMSEMCGAVDKESVDSWLGKSW